MLTSTQNFAQYQGNGATTIFPYTFPVAQASYLVVTLTNTNVTPNTVTTLSATQYSVTGIGGTSGGDVTYPVSGNALAAGWIITIQRVVPYQQNTSLTNQSAFYPQVIEGALDYLTMEVQQLSTAMGPNSVSNPVFYQSSLGIITPQQFDNLAGSANTYDSTGALNAALARFDSSGGILDLSPSNGLYLVSSPLIWPNDGSQYCYPITIRGANSTAECNGSNAPIGAPLATQILYTGATGTNCIDCQGGTGALYTWMGAIKGVAVFGPAGVPTSATPNGMSVYRAAGTLDNVSFMFFGNGMAINGPAYYENINNLFCTYNYNGVVASAANFNGQAIRGGRFSKNINFGFDGTYSGYPITFDGCWFEGNGSYGLTLYDPSIVNVTNCYFDTNVTADLNVGSGGSPYFPVLTVIGTNFAAGSNHYSIQCTKVTCLNIIGAYPLAYNNNVAINIGASDGTVGMFKGNRWPTAVSVTPVAPALMRNFEIYDAQNPCYMGGRANFASSGIPSSTAPFSTMTWAMGDQAWNSAVTATTTPGWICTTAGTPGTWTAMPVL